MASSWLRRLVLFAAAFSLTAIAQQSSGSIRGTVRDSGGGVVPGAKVHLVDTAQGDNREVLTNTEGVFFFNPLKPATYTLVIEMAGFKKFEQKEIRVFANDRLELPDISLSLSGR